MAAQWFLRRRRRRLFRRCFGKLHVRATVVTHVQQRNDGNFNVPPYTLATLNVCMNIRDALFYYMIILFGRAECQYVVVVVVLFVVDVVWCVCCPSIPRTWFARSSFTVLQHAHCTGSNQETSQRPTDQLRCDCYDKLNFRPSHNRTLIPKTLSADASSSCADFWQFAVV